VRLADPFVGALLFAAAGAWPIFRLLQRIGSRQTVSEFIPEHAKKQGTPTMGGLIILFGLLGAQLAQTSQGGESLAFAAIATTGFALIGFLDDFIVPRSGGGKRGLGWIPKLVLQIAVAGFVPGIAMLQAGTPSDLPRVALEVFVILFFVNAFNFADGMDGLAGGLLVILGACAAVMGLASGAPLSASLGVALAGAAIPFLFLNAPPAKVFMGDVGSMPIGALLGWIAIDLSRHIGRASGSESAGWIAVGIWGLVLIAELVPVPIQIASVKLLKRRVFAKTPIHHAFESKGVPETRIVWGFHLAQLALGLMATFYAVSIVAGNKP
jgi:phospho-N-acetylmuramoyl-pentapeptide-transferase